jgi:hypothetical protein
MCGLPELGRPSSISALSVDVGVVWTFQRERNGERVTPGLTGGLTPGSTGGFTRLVILDRDCGSFCSALAEHLLSRNLAFAGDFGCLVELKAVRF